jgi:hypothetical protein
MDPLAIPNARGRFTSLLPMGVVLLLSSLALIAQPHVRASPGVLLGWLATILLAGSVPVFLAQLLLNPSRIGVRTEPVFERIVEIRASTQTRRLLHV